MYVESVGFFVVFLLGALFWGAVISFVYKKIKQWKNKPPAAQRPVPPAAAETIQCTCPPAPAVKGICPGCHASVPEGMAFCMQCGTRVQ